MIAIQNLVKSFGKLDVLKGLDLELGGQGIVAILGPNGSGKTTLIKSLLGMVIPNQGSIKVDGSEVKNASAYRNKISYLPQIARFPENLTVRELIRMVKDLRNRREVSELHLVDYFDLKPHLDKRLGNLSGGTKQKVNLTLAFMFDTPYIFLDEPTAGLDPVALIRFKELLLAEKKAGKQIILTTHIMSLVEELADEIVFLLEGKIYFRGTVRDLEAQWNETSLERAIARILEAGISKEEFSPTGRQSKRPLPVV